VSRPIVFCTDYGTADEFVGICHGVMATIAPDSRVIDLTHAIPRHDVLRGALTIGRAAPYMPADAVYVGVVDPGVGSERRSIAVRTPGGAAMVGPDNGILSLAWEALGGAEAAVGVENDHVLLHPVSTTFHGRDVFAPAAAHLAAGFTFDELGPAIGPDELLTLEMPVPTITPGAIRAHVIGIDGFGNVQLNVRPDDLTRAGLGESLAVSGMTLPRVGIFADVPEGVLAAIVDSQGYIALVVNQGSAAETLGVKVDSPVAMEDV
jgi:S-adenosylmethionine hydrolase